MVKNPYRFYTYAYLREDRTPYYIGKGQNDRIYRKSGKPCGVPKNKSRIIFLKKNLTEQEAFNHEKYMISVFGRKDLGTGILRNKTNGGEGPGGRILTETQRQSVIESNIKRKGKKLKLTEEARNKISERNKRRKFSKETKQKISEKAKLRVGWKHKEETKIKMSKSQSKYIYELANPNQETFITDNLSKFCRENPQYGLYRRLLCDVAHGKQRHHKGWTVRILEHLT
jgi:hypothetical protein